MIKVKKAKLLDYPLVIPFTRCLQLCCSGRFFKCTAKMLVTFLKINSFLVCKVSKPL